MTPNQINLIQTTWAAIAPMADAAPGLFYQRLFEIDPTTKPLFAETDMDRQHAKLLDALSLVVDHADELGSLSAALEDLGRRHVGYGVEDHHYDSVGAALLWTLEQALGPKFTDEARVAWAEVFGLVATPMRRTMVQ
ncbi:MAG: globin domain-containing protein [Aestuariivirgaceae bacterium]